MRLTEFTEMIGATITRIEGVKVTANGTIAGSIPHYRADEMSFIAADGCAFVFNHNQSCCERVEIEDIVGDLDDLIGSPIVLAEQVSNDDPFVLQDTESSYTWTFYRFGTAKGSVTVRWLGTSNGCYSETVDYRCEPAPTCQHHDDCKENAELARACWLLTSGKVTKFCEHIWMEEHVWTRPTEMIRICSLCRKTFDETDEVRG